MQTDITSLLMDAALLLAVGMSVVFVFLSILIVVILGIRRLDNALPAVAADKPLQRGSGSTTQTEGVPPSVVAAITAAVHQYRQNGTTK
jgi:oxaloacetate decarboxylase (Na+ extruding) subunit gamma